MNALVDDKGALEINDVYMVRLSVDIYIQHTLSQPDYCDGHIEAEVDQAGIVNEEEYLISKMYEGVVSGEDKFMEVAEVNVGLDDDNVGVEGGNVGVEGSKVHDVLSSDSEDDSEDQLYSYDSALEVAFDYSSDGYDDLEEDEVANILDYEHHDEGKGKNRNKSEKKTRKNLKGVIMIVKNQ